MAYDADGFASCQDEEDDDEESDTWSREEAAEGIDYSPGGGGSSRSSLYNSPPPPPNDETPRDFPGSLSRGQRKSLAYFVKSIPRSPPHVQRGIEVKERHDFSGFDENNEYDEVGTKHAIDTDQDIDKNAKEEEVLRNHISPIVQERHETLEDLLAKTESEKVDLVRKLNDAETALTSMEAELAESRRQRRNLSEQLGAAEALCLVAQREATASEQCARDADRRAEIAFDQIAQLNAEVEVWRKNHSELSSALSLARRRLAAATDIRSPSPPNQRPTLAEARRRNPPMLEANQHLPRTSAAFNITNNSNKLHQSQGHRLDYLSNDVSESTSAHQNKFNLADDTTGSTRVKPSVQSQVVHQAPLARLAAQTSRPFRRSSPRRRELNGTAPFATASDDALMAQRQPYEQQLLKLQVERDNLIAEIARFPQATRSNAIRDRKIAAENQLQRIEAQTQRLKARLRDTSPLLAEALSPSSS